MSYENGTITWMKNEVTGSDSVRIPAPREGVATHIHRYAVNRAVIVHPTDFERFEALDELLAVCARAEPASPSEASIAAHIESVTPGEPVTDPDELRRLFA
jgi:hypothetical protein